MGNNTVEILAPAGGPEQLQAALACGADAVYLGAGALNARRSATNFDGDALRQAVEACHLRGVKLHLTVNTLILERERFEAEALVRQACALGIDALIVQDLGLIRMLRRCAPNMPLHASTQMAVHNLSGVRALEEMGFSRVVLARELSRSEIQTITQQTSLETEVFVHGALCMCISGQCYMSSIIGERSGNRGLCAQPCRLPFYERDPNRCGLSLKDLSLVEQLSDLRGLGVSSVKIEGRMKRPEYVAAAVTACREALDGQSPDLESLRSVFSRSGFTNGYYTSELGPDMFGTRQKEDVVSAQGVLKDLARLYQKESQRVGLRGKCRLEEGQPIELTATDAEGRTAQAMGEEPQAARNKPTTEEMARQSLQKLGGTPFYWEDLQIRCGEGLAVLVSQLNQVRREVLEQLTALRSAPQPIAWEAAEPEPIVMLDRGTTGPTLRARFARLEQVPAEATMLEEILLPVKEAARVEQPDVLAKLTVELPRIEFGDYQSMIPLLKDLQARGIRRASAGNLGALWLARSLGFAVTGDWALNVTNSGSIQQLAALGCREAVLSWELNLSDVKRLTRTIPCGLVAYGYLPLMIVRNCPARAERSCSNCSGITWMRDRIGNRVPVSCGGSRQVTEIYNHVPLWMADRWNELQDLDFLRLDFTIESREECAEVIQAYRLRTSNRPAELTRSLYFRNLQ